MAKSLIKKNKKHRYNLIAGNPDDLEVIEEYTPLNIENYTDRFNVKTLGTTSLEISDKLPYYKDYLNKFELL